MRKERRVHSVNIVKRASAQSDESESVKRVERVKRVKMAREEREESQVKRKKCGQREKVSTVTRGEESEELCHTQRRCSTETLTTE
jgi:hypothetical protein